MRPPARAQSRRADRPGAGAAIAAAAADAAVIDFGQRFAYNVAVQNARLEARFLCGPAGSGKTWRCLAEIRDALRDAPEGPPLILIAPKQATFQLERQLLEGGALKGFARLQILSFERLARFVFGALRAAPPELLSDEGSVMVLRALLLRHENELTLFRGSARRPGFAREISRLLNEFQQHQLSPEKLRAIAENKNLRAELRDKIRELALLRDYYSRWLAENHLQDAHCVLDAAAALLGANAGHPALRFSALWLDGFAEMTPQELDFLAAILPFCGRATLAFCLDNPAGAGTSWLSIWNSTGNTFEECRRRAEKLPGCQVEIETLPRDPKKSRFAKSPALRHLEWYWQNERPAKPPAADKAVRIVTCQNPEAEAVFAAREILKFVRAGNRFRDCAVLVRNLEPFHKIFARTFRLYGIPAFLDRREGIAHHPLAELTRSSLRAIAFDWRHEDWFAALKTGFCRAEEAEIDRLENEAIERGWQGKKWREPIQIPGDSALENRLEQLRKRIVPPFEALYRALAGNTFQPTGEQLAESLRELWNALRVEETLESWTANEPRERAAGGRQPAVHATALEQMNAWLDNVALAFATEAMGMRDWLAVLDAGLANLTVGVIPPTLDEVLIGAVDRARNPELKLCIVAGLNETIFPAAPAPPAILTDADRDELNHIVPLGGDLRQQLARDRYYGYIAFTRAGERVIATSSLNDASGKPLNPSPFLRHLQNVLPGCATEKFDERLEPGEIESVNEFIPMLLELQRVGADDVLKRFTSSEKIPKLMESLGALREPDPAENLAPAFAEALYGGVLRTSVSRLEEFAQCPFRFFVRSGLRAGERKLFELDARERGTFQHDALKDFHEQLVAEKKRWRDLTPGEARERIGQIAAAKAADFRGGLLRESPRAKFAARAMTEFLQDFVEVAVTWMREQYQFDPAAVELSFGEEDSRVPAWEIDLDGGHKLALRGRIDRIDICREPDGQSARAVVLDYKSSGKKLEDLLIRHGIQLQLAGYLNALRHFKGAETLFGAKKLLPSGMFYVNLRGQFENGRTRSEVLADAGQSRRMAYRHTGRFDAGALAQLDSAGAADQFNYALTKDGSVHKGKTEAMPRGEFETLLESVEAQLRRIGDEIFSGAAHIDPYRKGQETPCAYCDYHAACRIDPWSHRYRLLAAKNDSTE